MSYTNSTTNLKLPQWAETDYPNWDIDLNAAFKSIDDFAGSVDVSSIETLETQVATNTTDIGTLKTGVSDNTADISNLETSVNTVNSTVADLQTSVTTLQSTISSLQTQVANINTAVYHAMLRSTDRSNLSS